MLAFSRGFEFKLFESLRHAGSNPPSVSAVFIYASYLCLLQYSQAVFTLASCEMAVSPFILISSAYASFSSIKRGFVSAPELCFSTCVSRHHSSV